MHIAHELYLIIAIGEIDAKYLTFGNILFALIPVALTVLWYKIAPSLTPYIRNIICIASLLSAIILFIITPHKIECLSVAIGISLIAGIMLFDNWLDPENNILHSRIQTVFSTLPPLHQIRKDPTFVESQSKPQPLISRLPGGENYSHLYLLFRSIYSPDHIISEDIMSSC